MRTVSLITKIVIFLLLLAFAIKNSESVTVRYLLGLEWRAPLSLILLVVFALGVLLGMLGSSRQLTNLRSKTVAVDPP